MTIEDLITDTRTTLEIPEYRYPKIVVFPVTVKGSDFSDEQVQRIVEQTAHDLKT